MRKEIKDVTQGKIVSESEVSHFLWVCINTLNLRESFHPDKNFEDYKEFTKEEAGVLNSKMAECFKQCKKLNLDVYKISLKQI